MHAPRELAPSPRLQATLPHTATCSTYMHRLPAADQAPPWRQAAALRRTGGPRPQAGCPRGCSTIAVGKQSDAHAQPRSAHGRAKVKAALRHACCGRVWHLLPKAVCACHGAPRQVQRARVALVAHASACALIFPGITSTCMCAAAERPERPAHVRSVSLGGLRQLPGCRCAGGKSRRLRR